MNPNDSDEFLKHLRAGELFAKREEKHAPRGLWTSGNLAMAFQYSHAASLLVHAAVESRSENRVAYAAIFLYRHAVELTLKAICEERYLSPSENVDVPASGHWILAYWEPLAGWLKQREDWDELMQTLDANIRLLAEADVDGMTFRYADERALAKSVPISFDVEHAGAVLDEVIRLLEAIQTMRHEESSTEREMYSDVYSDYISEMSDNSDPRY